MTKVDYGMFTDAGNEMIHGIVVGARYKNLNWREVQDMLYTVSQIDGYRESTDTEVREMVYDALGFDTDFYV